MYNTLFDVAALLLACNEKHVRKFHQMKACVSEKNWGTEAEQDVL